MKIENYEQTAQSPVDMLGAAGCRVRWLIGSQDAAPNFAMRQFEVAAGGHTPRHQHDYEHEVFVLRGAGEVIDGDRSRPIRAGDAIYVAPNEVHQFRNTGEQPLEFLCLIPNSATGKSVQTLPECGVDKAASCS